LGGPPPPPPGARRHKTDLDATFNRGAFGSFARKNIH